MDFGLASGGQQYGSRLTQSGYLIGTPEYMAPEQISGEEVDGRADLYSLGIILYEMLSGRQPFGGDTPVKVLFQHLEGEVEPLEILAPDVPVELIELVNRAMARGADERPATAEDFQEDLRGIEISRRASAG